jgi:hypothetical protein
MIRHLLVTAIATTTLVVTPAPDPAEFALLAKAYHPETGFHPLGGNVAKSGLTADLEAIAGAGLSGIQLFPRSRRLRVA